MRRFRCCSHTHRGEMPKIGHRCSAMISKSSESSARDHVSGEYMLVPRSRFSLVFVLTIDVF
jgi:hypothetical protein